ncbi:MAG: hypothetical protein FGM39_06730 [Phycisphaerales bacterium]|nr:hypothetical protein [Phycisphaerales bacterium]
MTLPRWLALPDHPGASCDERERNAAVAAIAACLVLGVVTLVLAVLAIGATGTVDDARLGLGSRNSGTGDGDGFGASVGDGSALDGTGPGGGSQGTGKGARASTRRNEAPRGTATGAVPDPSAATGESLVAGTETELPKFGFTPPTPDDEIVDTPVAASPGELDGYDGEGAAGKGGASGRARFMGINTSAKDIVYVLDMSGSMGEADGRAERLRRELGTSLSSLPKDARFSIIIFGLASPDTPDDRYLTTPNGNRRAPNATILPPGALVEATPASRSGAAAWVGGKNPMAGTWSHAWDSLRAALEMKPEAIFLLSDGEFDPSDMEDVLTTIERFNPERRTRIHTVAFASSGDVPGLQRIAKDWGGLYRHVPLGP